MIIGLGKYLDKMVIPQDIQSAAFEYYLHYSKPFDREVFSSLPFEDNLGEGRILKALDFWNSEIDARGVWQGGGGYVMPLPLEFRDMAADSLYVKFYRFINERFPKGSRKREVIKNIGKLFI